MWSLIYSTSHFLLTFYMVICHCFILPWWEWNWWYAKCEHFRLKCICMNHCHIKIRDWKSLCHFNLLFVPFQFHLFLYSVFSPKRWFHFHGNDLVFRWWLQNEMWWWMWYIYIKNIFYIYVWKWIYSTHRINTREMTENVGMSLYKMCNVAEEYN